MSLDPCLADKQLTRRRVEHEEPWLLEWKANVDRYAVAALKQLIATNISGVGAYR